MTVRILTGDCRTMLATLPAASVQCCVTSPPYANLRDYGHPDQIGAEATAEEYISELVNVFRLVRRVLRDDGTVWLNLGDGMADKQLRMIPARVAIALQDDGWVLRSDVIWHKVNPMPESVQGTHFARHMVTIEEYERLTGLPYPDGQADPTRSVPCPGCEKCAQHHGYTFHLSAGRPTSAHEHVFLLSKRASYFYDAEGVAERAEQPPGEPSKVAQHKSDQTIQGGKFSGTLGTNQGAATRNLRNVWTIATRPEGISHFALMPPDLAERCIKAGTSERGQCPHCAAPWARVVERGPERDGIVRGLHPSDFRSVGQPQRHANGGLGTRTSETTGWSPTCACPEHAPVPQTVLDPFGGAGTTGLVADRLGRNAVLIELNPDYAKLARNRVTADAPLFAEVAD